MAEKEHPTPQPHHRSDCSGTTSTCTPRKGHLTNNITGVQGPDKYAPACAANRDESSLGVDGKGGGVVVSRDWESVGDAVCEMFPHVNRPGNGREVRCR